jgi:hypothetical protein
MPRTSPFSIKRLFSPPHIVKRLPYLAIGFGRRKFAQYRRKMLEEESGQL